MSPDPSSTVGAVSRVDAEFDRQRDTLAASGYSAATGLGPGELADLVEPLRAIVVQAVDSWSQDTPSVVPFVLVVSPKLARAEDLVPLITLAGGTRPGVVDRNHGGDDLSSYQPLAVLDVPEAPAYALVDVDRGEEFCGVRPADALPTILARGRTPLTIHEGLALVAQFPAALEKNHCFMLAGSRRADRRVPALWISNKAPKLGWCWDGNPHSWLGTASAGSRAA